MMRYVRGMKLRDWRLSKNLTLKDAAELFEVGAGKNPSRSMQRVENGEVPVDAPLAARIVERTDGSVGLQDLHDMRREFLSRVAEAA